MGVTVLKRTLYTRMRAGVAAILALAGLLAAGPAVAQGAAVATTTITFPTTVAVGQSGLSGSLTLRNQNTSPQAGATNTVCNAGDAAPPCAAGEDGIVLVPSCGELAGDACAAGKADPGVFSIAPSASGRAGTACAGMAFSASIVDAPTGAVHFAPPGGDHVTIAGSGAACVIDFTFTVLKLPAIDQNPATEGVQTAQATVHTQFIAPITAGSAKSQARDTSKSTVDALNRPVVNATASPNITLGAGALSVSANVSGRDTPVAGATLDFRLYGPDDATCATAPAFQSLAIAYPAAGGAVSSAPFQPVLPGTYRWVASYSGDANNAPVTSACGAAGTMTVVTAPLAASDRDEDGVRDSLDKCPGFAGNLPNGCPTLLSADVRGVWRVNDLLSKLVSLTVRAPLGSRIVLRCSGRKGACGFRTRTVAKTTKRTTGLTRNFKRPRILPAGTRITVYVTKPRYRGTYERVLTRTGRRLPAVADRCLNAAGEVQGCP
jgi:hypothetical protein